jgi:hypothetical protein
MLFIGSILPFLIVEIYFQNYETLAYLVLLTSVVLTSCVIIESLKARVAQLLDFRQKDLEGGSRAKEKPEAASLYYFRNYW